MNNFASQTYPIELLAPAKDLDCGKIAILAGADALYIGAPQFSARVNASNTLEDIRELVEFAHIYHVRVYVALNTILDDDELAQAVKLIWELDDCGVDGVIIQDLGIMDCDLPKIPIISSTQMDNRSVDKVKFEEKVGFQRTILARELSLEEIKNIREHTSIEIEAFIHGALCVCYSGQCYLSYAMGGRSGNRGECAQPCRKEYQLFDKKHNSLGGFKHWLSLRDLNASEEISDLLDAGVTSFKIEGRLKGENYVKNVVQYYRRLLDKEIAKRGWKRASLGSSTVGFEPNPHKSFNRGFTNYFLKKRSDRMARHETPKAVGEYIGRVTQVSSRSFQVSGDKSLHNGDGVLFLEKGAKVFGTQIQSSEKGQLIPLSITGIQKGLEVYRNLDREFEKKLTRSKMTRRIPLSGAFSQEGNTYTLSLSDELGSSVVKGFDFSDAELAKDTVRMEGMIQKQIARMGETEFALNPLVFNYRKLPFIPASRLNEMRREVLKSLSEKRKSDYVREERKRGDTSVAFPSESVSYEGNVYNKRAAEYLKKHACEVLESAAEKGLDLSNRKVMTTRYCLKYEMKRCPLKHKENPLNGPLFLEDKKGVSLRLEFNCKDCEVDVYLEEGTSKE